MEDDEQTRLRELWREIMWCIISLTAL